MRLSIVASAGAGEPRAGYELPLLLFGGFRAIIDELHAELGRRGHPDMRPAHGFAMQAVGPRGRPPARSAGGWASPSRRPARPSSAWSRLATRRGPATPATAAASWSASPP